MEKRHVATAAQLASALPLGAVPRRLSTRAQAASRSANDGMDSGQTQCDAASDCVSAPAEPLVSTVQLLLADSKLLPTCL